MNLASMSSASSMTRIPGITALLALTGALWPVGAAAGSTNANSGEGYRLGDEIPVSYDLGKLQYVPFVTCNETARPLSLHYGVSETITCTVPELPDNLYHLLEFYVHSDVPMTCRIPTAPLTKSNTFSPESNDESVSKEFDSLAALNENGPPFTPVTIALQGTLQKSHLHIWTDMNMLMHNMASDAAAQQSTQNSQTGQPGYAVAGTAYSTPEFEAAVKNVKLDDDDKAVALAQAAREPWTPGHGTKVIRGEPLTFSFHVAWVEGGAGIGWPDRPASYSFLGPGGKIVVQSSGSSSFFSRMFLFLMAASVGALGALYWERNRDRIRGRSSWKGDGILGVSPARGKGASVTFGNGGRMNGYGGYTATAVNGAGAGGGYGGFVGGKKD
ncbi:hypothetical protein N7532_000432 [Penicillium argentinense]|uniref:Uncharacterized protein n=1 Tax=Penicillium argentinense TaxID=1131581 RepID=A0A9W9G6R1_9EURO|nr:uncharacterized protein N7532_000432 [Penicillium argentinense]KAJ5112387.1 hypothetical protein N7532_000432 [Penicillium argentinense]